jgi:hypothetical protein
MRRLIHWLVLACGFALVCLRLYPSDDIEWISNLFFDDAIRLKIEAISLQMINGAGISLTNYPSYASNLTSLVHTFVILLEVLVIAAVSYLVARKI